MSLWVYSWEGKSEGPGRTAMDLEVWQTAPLSQSKYGGTGEAQDQPITQELVEAGLEFRKRKEKEKKTD